MSGTGRSRQNIERNFKTTIEENSLDLLLEDYNLSVEINDEIFEKLNDYVLEQKETNDYDHHQNEIANYIFRK